ncbi:MAG: hypothetical protein HN576_16550, partial [Bacteriovoracaceae bacterium]|nr:hypothetical protein [Bacteriovoracaceae bacterium]
MRNNIYIFLINNENKLIIIIRYNEEQLKTYNLLEVKDIEELEIEKNINTGMSKLLKGPYIEDTIWSVAKW